VISSLSNLGRSLIRPSLLNFTPCSFPVILPWIDDVYVRSSLSTMPAGSFPGGKEMGFFMCAPACPIPPFSAR